LTHDFKCSFFQRDEQIGVLLTDKIFMDPAYQSDRRSPRSAPRGS
jgi:hypothetical protein